MPYKHGTYGEIGDSRVAEAPQCNTVAVYFGTAPVNLIRGYADADIINNPIQIRNMPDAQKRVGCSSDWKTFALCEAFAQHFDNTVENVGPIFIVNVLDPDTHRVSTQIKKELTFKNGWVEFESDTIILDTFAIADKAEGVDYTLAYNFEKGTVVVKALDNMATADSSYYEVDPDGVGESDIIGEATAAGEYTGIHALSLLYQNENAVADILVAPGWSHKPAVYAALVKAAHKINGHWDAFVNADIPLVDGSTKIDTLAAAIEWKDKNGYATETSKVYWPMAKDENSRLFHLSTVATATMMRVDLSRNGIPYASPSNTEIMATGQYFGDDSKNRGFDKQAANRLNEKGITTAVFWVGRWVLWGPHTAAYSYDGEMDARAIFDVNMRMLMYITNGFQLDHGTQIDEPMTVQDSESIRNNEQEKLDELLGIGALIGNPSVRFLESDNPVSDMINGEFVWDIAVTNTPPFKAGTARVCYTDEGFAAFFGGEQ